MKIILKNHIELSDTSMPLLILHTINILHLQSIVVDNQNYYLVRAAWKTLTRHLEPSWQQQKSDAFWEVTNKHIGRSKAPPKFYFFMLVLTVQYGF